MSLWLDDLAGVIAGRCPRCLAPQGVDGGRRLAGHRLRRVPAAARNALVCRSCGDEFAYGAERGTVVAWPLAPCTSRGQRRLGSVQLTADNVALAFIHHGRPVPAVCVRTLAHAVYNTVLAAGAAGLTVADIAARLGVVRSRATRAPSYDGPEQLAYSLAAADIAEWALDAPFPGNTRTRVTADRVELREAGRRMPLWPA